MKEFKFHIVGSGEAGNLGIRKGSMTSRDEAINRIKEEIKDAEKYGYVIKRVTLESTEDLYEKDLK